MQRLVLAILFALGALLFPVLSFAAVSITTATGGSAINADTTGGTFTTLTGPTITEGANRDITTGTIIVNAPSGFTFNTGASVTATITRDAGTKSCFTFSATTATPAASTITFTVSAIDGTGGGTATTCHVTFSNIQVRPTAGTPLASGSITKSGTETGIPGASSLGALSEVVGAKSQVAITQQPDPNPTRNIDFATKPVVAIEDQFGNVETGDSASTIATAVVLSSQTCGGTPGSGTLTSTPASGAAVSSGVLSYTAMQYSFFEDIRICFSSSGISSALSNTISVARGTIEPSVGTDLFNSFTPTSATIFGDISDTGGENASTRGFAISLNPSLSPSSSVSTTSESGSFDVRPFSVATTTLLANTTYYYRAYASNSAGIGYGIIRSFTTGNNAPARKMRLFFGFKVRFAGGKLKLVSN